MVKTFLANNYDDLQELLQQPTGVAETPAEAVSLERKPGEQWANKVQRKLKEAKELAEVAKQYTPTDEPPAPLDAMCTLKDHLLMIKIPQMLLQWKGMPSSCKPENVMSPANLMDRRGAFTQIHDCVKDFMDVSMN